MHRPTCVPAGASTDETGAGGRGRLCAERICIQLLTITHVMFIPCTTSLNTFSATPHEEDGRVASGVGGCCIQWHLSRARRRRQRLANEPGWQVCCSWWHTQPNLRNLLLDQPHHHPITFTRLFEPTFVGAMPPSKARPRCANVLRLFAHRTGSWRLCRTSKPTGSWRA